MDELDPTGRWRGSCHDVVRGLLFGHEGRRLRRSGRGRQSRRANLTALGWTLLAIGVIQLIVGFGIMAGSTGAGVIAIAGAFLNATVNMAWLSVHPVWSLLIITPDILVIYGLIAHGDEIAV